MKGILLVMLTCISTSAFTETEAQWKQGILQFEFLRAIGGGCSVPDIGTGFVNYTYDRDCIIENEDSISKACASEAGKHFIDLCEAANAATNE